MLLKVFVILLTVLCCQSAIYSSFWAPLYDRRILNYRVDVPFQSDTGHSAREWFENEHGYRGERLIADLGNGNGPRHTSEVAGLWRCESLLYISDKGCEDFCSTVKEFRVKKMHIECHDFVKIRVSKSN